MEVIKWNSVKSQRLKKTRGVSFEEITASKFIGTRDHPTKEHQQILVYEYKNYLWAVPYVKEGEVTFLKTIYRSRKLLKIYQRKDLYEKNQIDKV